MPAGSRPSSKVRLTALFFNTEGCFARRRAQQCVCALWQRMAHTAVKLDILNGVMRRAVLADSQHYFKHRAHFRAPHTQAQLRQADEIVL